jgi:hypothetical protein
MPVIAGVQFDEPSGWYITGAGTSVAASGSIPTPIPFVSASVGATAYSFIVKNRSHEADSYICRVSAVLAGVSGGWSLISFGSFSYGPGSYNSGGIFSVLRQPFAPGPQGEGGPPTGFLGPCLSNNVGGTIRTSNAGVQFMMLGSTLGLASLLAAGQPTVAKYAAFKYSGAFWSTGISVTPGINVEATVHLGIVTHFDWYRARRGDNKMVHQGTTYWGPIADALRG